MGGCISVLHTILLSPYVEPYELGVLNLSDEPGCTLNLVTILLTK